MIAVRIHHLVQARAALARAEALALDVTLLSAPEAACFAGAGFLAALGRKLGRPLVVDCGNDAGIALAALRAGCRDLLFSGDAALAAKLAEIAAQLGGRVRAALDLPVIPLGPDDEAAEGLAAGLSPASARSSLPGGVAGPERASAPRSGARPAWSAVPAGVRGTPRFWNAQPTRGAPAMRLTPKVKEILSWYESENPGVKTNLARLLMHGKLGGTGRLVILPVDQGFEHGPARSFAPNPAAYDPNYLFELAIEAGLSAYAAPLGPLEFGAVRYAGEVPLILKLNSANSLSGGSVNDQALTASVDDALRLGCVGVGFTIYPGSDACYAMQEELREIIREAKAKGLVPVVWSYPRGGKISKDGETALDIVAYAAHMAALMGATIIKVKPPKAMIDLEAAKGAYQKAEVPMDAMSQRIRHVMQAAFDGKRLVVFSGGEAKGTEGLLEEIKQIRDGGGHGSIIGRNSFQRPKPQALELLDTVIRIYKGEA